MDQDIRHNLEILRSQSLSSLAEQHLEREIFSGRMPPGVRINEVNIAKSIGISRGPVREACRTLAKAGWLEFIPNRGCFVREVSFEEAMELYEIRIGYARMIGELVAERVTPADLNDLRAMIETMWDINRSGDTAQITVIGLKFHRALAASTKNKKLKEMYINLHFHHRLFRLGALTQLDSFPEKLIEWNKTVIKARESVIDVLSQGDQEACGESYADLVAQSRDRSKALYQEFLAMKMPNEAAAI